MNHNTAGDDLQAISGLLEEWKARGSIGALEYDVLLDKIKNLYESVRFCGEVHLRREAPHITESQVNDATEHVESGEVDLPDDYTVNAVKGLTGGTGDLQPRHHIRRHVVRALYDDGDDTAVLHDDRQFAAAAPFSDQKPVTGSGDDVSHPAYDKCVAGASYDINLPGTPAAPLTGVARVHVLGEVIGSGAPILGDSLNVTATGIASKPGHEKLASLRQYIGLNDRFMLIRDLFGGDAAAFEEALEVLDSFTAIEDALLFVHDNYLWNGESDAAALLADLLARKLI